MEVGKEGGIYTYRYTVTTRMTPSLCLSVNNWALSKSNEPFHSDVLLDTYVFSASIPCAGLGIAIYRGT